jgi:hypothetical protein
MRRWIAILFLVGCTPRQVDESQAQSEIQVLPPPVSIYTAPRYNEVYRKAGHNSYWVPYHFGGTFDLEASGTRERLPHAGSRAHAAAIQPAPEVKRSVGTTVISGVSSAMHAVAALFALALCANVAWADSTPPLPTAKRLALLAMKGPFATFDSYCQDAVAHLFQTPSDPWTCEWQGEVETPLGGVRVVTVARLHHYVERQLVVRTPRGFYAHATSLVSASTSPAGLSSRGDLARTEVRSIDGGPPLVLFHIEQRSEGVFYFEVHGSGSSESIQEECLLICTLAPSGKPVCVDRTLPLELHDRSRSAAGESASVEARMQLARASWLGGQLVLDVVAPKLELTGDLRPALAFWHDALDPLVGRHLLLSPSR